MIRFGSTKVWPDGVFIVGCHRSGTTLLRYLLDAHPEIACPPESKFISGLHSFIEYPQAVMGMRSLGLTEEQISDMIRKFVLDVFRVYTTQQSKRFWIDKTPNYSRILPFIDRILRHNAKYILCVRHPFDCASSLLAAFQNATALHEDSEARLTVQTYGNDIVAWSQHWRDINERLLAFGVANCERCFVVRYEQLVADPAGRLGGLLDFLGIERIPGDVAHMCRDALSVPHSRGHQDGKIRRTTSIHENSIGRWRDWPACQTAGLWPIVGATATEFGYAFDRERPLVDHPTIVANHDQVSAQVKSV